MSNNQKYALITGATSGIGYELAKIFAKDQYNLVIVARSIPDLDRISSEFKQQYGIEVIPINKDLSLREGPFEVYNEVMVIPLSFTSERTDSLKEWTNAFVA